MLCRIITGAITTREDVVHPKTLMQRKLKVNPSARVKNTNCPFQMIVKIDVKDQCNVDVEWEHNHSVETLEASNFRDLCFECIEKVNKLYESGHTPSTARQQYLKEL